MKYGDGMKWRWYVMEMVTHGDGMKHKDGKHGDGNRDGMRW
jgi:hypothetical protein